MKKAVSLLLAVTASTFLMACGVQKEAGNSSADSDDVTAEIMAEEPAGDSRTTEDTITETMTSPAAAEETESSKKAGSETDTGTGNSEILVAYFSATGNTKAVAEKLADGLQADLYEIVPMEPYTDADLDYNDDDSRSTQEMNDSSARPEIAGMIENFEDYTTVYLGYPIWWGEAPRILDTFAESYDFTGKTVIPFRTSGGSGIGSSADMLEELAGSGNWMEGQRFSENEDAEEIISWAEQFR